MFTPVTDATFEDLTSHALANTSYLKLFNVLQDDDDTYLLNIFRFYSINESIVSKTLNYSAYEAQDADWWDQIANQYYGIPNLWWAVCVTNSVINPFEELEPGKQLKIMKDAFLPIMLREMQEIEAK